MKKIEELLTVYPLPDMELRAPTWDEITRCRPCVVRLSAEWDRHAWFDFEMQHDSYLFGHEPVSEKFRIAMNGFAVVRHETMEELFFEPEVIGWVEAGPPIVEAPEEGFRIPFHSHMKRIFSLKRRVSREELLTPILEDGPTMARPVGRMPVTTGWKPNRRYPRPGHPDELFGWKAGYRPDEKSREIRELALYFLWNNGERTNGCWRGSVPNQTGLAEKIADLKYSEADGAHVRSTTDSEGRPGREEAIGWSISRIRNVLKKVEWSAAELNGDDSP